MKHRGPIVASFLTVVLCACGGEVQPAVDGGRDAEVAQMDASQMDASVTQCVAPEECDDGVYCNGSEACTPGDPAADARGCVHPGSRCMEGESCDEALQRCLSDCGAERDADGDGHESSGCAGDDCDDSDGNRFPGNAEVCDAAGHDEDCRVDTFGFQDLDSDGYVDAACCNTNPSTGETLCGDDCNDMRAVAHPDRTEVCDGFDNDCDTDIDEGALRSFYPDADDDGFGDASASPVMACEPPAAHVENADDCDDTNPAAHSATAPEVCDGADNDCDTTVDESTMVVAWYRDVDGDLFGDAEDPAPVMSCLPVAGHVPNAGDCDDSLGAVNPSAPETCNGMNDDCDSMTDEGVEITYYRDADGDMHGSPSTTMTGCAHPDGYVVSDDDCDDIVATTHPGAPELCNNVDDDCSSGGGAIGTEDADGDEHTSMGAACSGGYPKDDCDDGRPDVYGGAPFYYDVPFECRTSLGGLPARWCSARGCCIASVTTCNGFATCASGATPRWDYDCSGTADPAPPGDSCHETFGICGGGGPLYSGAPPACGAAVMYRTCTDNPLGSGCLENTSTRPMPCR